jgi:hypothetical protein
MHLIGGTIFYSQFAALHSVCDEKISDVNVSCPTPTGRVSIPFQEDGTLVILKYNIVVHSESLSLQKIVSPHDERHGVVNANDFCFSGALGVDLLFLRE